MPVESIYTGYLCQLNIETTKIAHDVMRTVLVDCGPELNVWLFSITQCENAFWV
jgi:hypothetical protein